MTPETFVEALDTWTRTGGKLPDFFRHYLTTEAEAEAVVRALEHGDLDGVRNAAYPVPNLFGVAALVQSTFDPAVDAIFRQKALAPLRAAIHRVMDQVASPTTGASATPEPDFASKKRAEAALFALRVVAFYGDPQDNDLIVRAARNPYRADDSSWSTLLDYVQRNNSAAGDILEALRDPLPDGFLRIAYLDFANALAFDSNVKGSHPFDTQQGVAFLLKQVSNRDEGFDSYAVSSIAAAPFLVESSRRQVLERARKHPRRHIRREVEWAVARCSGASAKAFLLKAHGDPRTLTRAARYLKAMNLDGLIGPPSTQVDALRQASDWLADEQDFFGQPPDKIFPIATHAVIIPPDGATRTVYIIGYRHGSGKEKLEGAVAVSTGSVDHIDDPDGSLTEFLVDFLRADEKVRAAYPEATWNDDAFWRELLHTFNPGMKP